MDVKAARAKLSAAFPFEVVQNYDGCPTATGRVFKVGTMEQCKDFIRKHWYSPLQEGKLTLEILDRKTGRYVSFLL